MMSEATPDLVIGKLSRRWKPTKRLKQLLKIDSGRLRRRAGEIAALGATAL